MRRKERAEAVAHAALAAMAGAMVLPLVAIVVYLVVRAWPSLSPMSGIALPGTTCCG